MQRVCVMQCSTLCSNVYCLCSTFSSLGGDKETGKRMTTSSKCGQSLKLLPMSHSKCNTTAVLLPQRSFIVDAKSLSGSERPNVCFKARSTQTGYGVAHTPGSSESYKRETGQSLSIQNLCMVGSVSRLFSSSR